MPSAAQTLLPTCPPVTRTGMTAFLGALRHECTANQTANGLTLLTYSASLKGWRVVRSMIIEFANTGRGRPVTAYIGLDDLLTQPSAIREMMADGVTTFLVSRWPNTFHPKIFAFTSRAETVILAGSNNLTERGLTSNFEFGVRASVTGNEQRPYELWLSEVASIAHRASERLIREYERQYRAARRLRRRSLPTSTSRVRELAEPNTAPARVFRRAIVEVMERETGTSGTQIQMPMEVVRTFFGLAADGAATFQVTNDDTSDSRDLTMTAFRNNTARLSLSEVTLNTRPCVLELWWRGADLRFRLVQRSLDRREYTRLISTCIIQTRRGSKRFALLRS